MPRWFNSPLQLHRRWKETKNRSNQQNNKRCINGQYKLLHEIGHGASGIVHLAVDIKTNIRYAIKELNKPKLQRQYHSELLRQSGPARRRTRNLSSSSSESLIEDTILGLKRRKLNENGYDETVMKELYIEESNLLKKLAPHENIIQFIKVMEDPNYKDSIFIVMEYAEKGIIMDVTPQSITKSFSDTQCRNIFKQLVEAINHLHKNGVIHRDIKPQNLLLSNDNLVKLIDFGNATIVSDTLRYNSTGTPAFMAPELLKKVPRNQVKSSPTCADLWSMGVTLYCFTYGRLPFEKSSLLDLYADIQNKSISHPSSEKIDPDLIDLINKLLEKNPNDRITMEQVKSHPWLSK